MYKYFCNSCGTHFEQELPERDENGLLNDIVCPNCGIYDIYTDTTEGAAQSVKDLSNYENIMNLWED
jgi:DNA-directed RNA polymerase subunit RPC12/RpoP